MYVETTALYNDPQKLDHRLRYNTQSLWRFEMTKKRKQYNQQFKFKVALEAVQELRTISEIASAYNVHPTQVKNWKKQLLRRFPTINEETKQGRIGV